MHLSRPRSGRTPTRCSRRTLSPWFLESTRAQLGTLCVFGVALGKAILSEGGWPVGVNVAVVLQENSGQWEQDTQINIPGRQDPSTPSFHGEFWEYCQRQRASGRPWGSSVPCGCFSTE